MEANTLTLLSETIRSSNFWLFLIPGIILACFLAYHNVRIMLYDYLEELYLELETIKIVRSYNKSLEENIFELKKLNKHIISKKNTKSFENTSKKKINEKKYNIKVKSIKLIPSGKP